MPAMRRASSAKIAIVNSRIRNPTVPAVAGSIRRMNVGPAALPMSRASAQPSATSRITVAIWIGVWRVFRVSLPTDVRT